MNTKVHEFLNDKMPVVYYKLLSVRRNSFVKGRSRLTLSEIKALDDQMYFEHIGKHVNWEHPTAYTEKMQLEKLMHNFPEKSILADKYLVRDWVSDKIGKEYLVPLCFDKAFNSVYDIDFASLPNSFVIKTNAGSGDAAIIRNKNNLTKKDWRRIQSRLEYQLHFHYAWVAYEMHYEKIEPKIIIEQLLECDEADLPDYKFLCFDGKPMFCWVDKGRYHHHKRNVYDLDWNLQEWNQKDYGNYEGVIPKPQNFDKMIEIASILSSGFAHVRVDLYDVNGKIYFGEMTFTNGGGFEPITPDEADIELGKLWNLDF